MKAHIHPPTMRAMSYLLTVLLFASAWPAAHAGDAPYVNSKITKERFAEITAADMDLLRSKKILFASRSFGLNLCGGLRSLATKDKKYEFLSSYQRYDVFKAGGELKAIPADAFAKSNFVHFLATYWPHTKRVEELDGLIRLAPHQFGQQLDIAIIYFHTARPDAFDTYAQKMDALQKDFPKVKFIYVTAGFMADSRAKDNEAAHAFSEKVRARYKGKAPLYDFGKILSDDFRSGHAYCPEYSSDPAGVHPNLEAGQEMMAKAFLLILRDAMQSNAPSKPALAEPLKTEKKEEPALAAGHPDAKAVRAILDANGLKEKTVASVSVVKNSRIVELYLQEGGIAEITAHIGTLTELRVLHVYGDRNLPHPRLKTVSPFIGRCKNLEDLLLNQNELTTLPAEICKLTRLKSLSIADNRLKDLPKNVRDWAMKFDMKGLADQRQ